MKFLIVSDDHGIEAFEQAYKLFEKKYGEPEAVIHAGDISPFNKEYYERIAGCPVYLVRGNNDYNDAPMELLLEFGNRKVFVTHGHRYGVYMGLQNLAYAAEERGADIVVFGHTHHALHVKAKGVHFINPGSLALPRGGSVPSCACMILDESGEKGETEREKDGVSHTEISLEFLYLDEK